MDPVGVLDDRRLRTLIDAGRQLVAELDLSQLLENLLGVAIDITGARYAALGALDEERRSLERFLARGIDEKGRAAIGELPRGRGLLGVLVDDPRPLRLKDLNRDPRSYGFPPGHPPMSSFLGVPILIGGQAWGNLYLTEKAGGEFSAADEAAAVVLGEWARSPSTTLDSMRAPYVAARSSNRPSGGWRRPRRSRAPSAARRICGASSR